MIIELLQEGQGNAISRAELCRITGLPDRAVRLQIAQERRNGALILSSVESGGYFKAADVDELRRFVKSMDARARSTFAALTEARRVLRMMEQQEETNG